MSSVLAPSKTSRQTWKDVLFRISASALFFGIGCASGASAITFFRIDLSLDSFVERMASVAIIVLAIGGAFFAIFMFALAVSALFDPDFPRWADE